MKRCLTSVAIALCAASANAQALNDPMRPPYALMSAPTGAEVQSKAPTLQTIVIGSDRRYAIIDGAQVFTGSLVGDAKVVRIVENEVTLRDSGGDTVLKLYPEVKKLIVAPKPSAGGAERGLK